MRHLVRTALNRDRASFQLMLATLWTLLMAGATLQADLAPAAGNVRSNIGNVAIAAWRASPTIRPPDFSDWIDGSGFYRNWYPMKYYIGPAPRFLGFPLVAGSIWWFWILVLAAMHIELCALAQWIVVRIGTPSLHLRQRGVAGTSLAVVIASSSIALVPLAGFASCVNVAWEEITRASSFAGTAGLDLTWAARGSIAAAFTISYLSAVWSITRRACSRWAKSNHLSPPSIHNAALCLHCGYPIGGAYSCPECGSPDPRQLPPALYMPWELRLRGRSTRHIPRLLFWAALISLYCAPWILGTIRSIPQ